MMMSIQVSKLDAFYLVQLLWRNALWHERRFTFARSTLRNIIISPIATKFRTHL